MATVAYVIVSSCQLKTTRDQLATMKSQLDTMNEQLHTAERAWLVFRSARDLELKKGRLPGSVDIFLFNAGRGPVVAPVVETVSLPVTCQKPREKRIAPGCLAG